jgi:hypothetical protein
MSTDRIEKLYKNFGILADTKDKSEVSLHLVLAAQCLDPQGVKCNHLQSRTKIAYNIYLW